ncbi:putative pre-mrna cleavage complex ii protein clp1 protein [Zalerion maritima]|uniref:Polynucleotide 5'-hydroxyl-kinase GRC3 n=1 Tax=Zalerion maritima TaxID=339359 RepID=A0AAD5WTQ4_9PEZI|nr:putative pre-mrna cleavage complex ii protein clp1 protein [Zalerion maritima]
MSIPGLGSLPSAPTKALTETISIPPLGSYTILIPRYTPNALTITLTTGTAERDGVELARNTVYNFRGPIRTKIFSFTGCSVSVEEGGMDDDVGAATNVVFPSMEGPEKCVMSQYLNLHALLEQERARARRATVPGGVMGPRVLVAGPRGSGKSSLVKMLAAWSTKMGGQPILVNLDPREGVLTLPGTLSASAMATNMDVETRWGITPSSGPSAIPVKLPVVWYLGREYVGGAQEGEDGGGEGLWETLVGRLARTASARLVRDEGVRGSGVVVDTQGLILPSSSVQEQQEGDGEGDGEGGMTLNALAHAVEELSINIVVVLAGSETDSIVKRVQERFRFEKTSLGEQVRVVQVDRDPGAVVRDEAFMRCEREAGIKEYFFGDMNRTLSPFTQMVEFDGLVVWRNWEGVDEEGDSKFKQQNPPGGVAKYTRLTDPTPELSTWCLAVMCLPATSGPEEVQHASVKGFVYVADVDRERRRLKILTPVSGRLGDNPLLWGRWPEPFINLLG